ncbi:hypothetical protein GGI1_06120 [Acidithiobacillus sp. GGI-221]|nr:hypothetical protein GGI1_06120 [Acidithiobacillus sp. GGI-221]
MHSSLSVRLRFLPCFCGGRAVRWVALPLPRDSTGWYARHPDALAAENQKCWKLLQDSSFADVDRVMAAHPHCHAVYEALQSQDPPHVD